jgi:hypothetical protein
MGIKSSRWSQSVLALLSTVAVSFTASCSSKEPATAEVLDPTQSHYGKTDSEWGAAWWKWLYEIPQSQSDAGMPVCTVPAQDPTGEYCGLGQSGDVFFLAGAAGGGTVVRDKCSVPLGKAILFPIVNFIDDNEGVPLASQMPTATLMATVQADMAGVSVPSLSAEFDGAPITDLARFATQVTKFDYTLPPEPNLYTCEGESGVSGHVDESYAAGYYVMLAPPPAGAHVLKFAGTFTAGMNMTLSIDVTYKFMVQ